ncbi:hypothetical protein TruAng_000284 [Truncatella angustata]|nr:hypothetical protein TruAng_000284 [Truncatella angustata]
MVAVLSTISRMTLLAPVAACISQTKWRTFQVPNRLRDFEIQDEASRGLYGALLLLFSRWPSKLAATGAVVTLAATAFGPFTQQILSFESRDLFLPNTSVSFGFSREYATLANTSQSESFYIPVGDLDWTMRGAVTKALYNMDITPEFNCSSTCMWNGVYNTLGFNYKCENVTAVTLETRQCQHPSPSFYNCSMTTPGNTTIKTNFIQTQEQTTKFISSSTHSSWSLRGWQWYPGITDQGLDFVHIAQYLVEPDINKFDTFAPNITECTISMAAWSLSDAVARGNSFDTNKTEIALGQNLSIRSCERITDKRCQYAQLNATENGLSFEINMYDWMAITAFITSQLSDIEEKTTEVLSDWEKEASPILASSAGDITDWVPRMTQSMTDTLRSGTNKQLAYGSSLESIVYVQVTWVWAILPFATEICALILLVLTIWESRASRGIPLWKSSAVAMLFYDIHESSHETTPLVLSTRLQSKADLKAVLNQTARLSSWQLEQNDDLETDLE